MNRLSQWLSGWLPFFYGYVMVLVAMLAQVCSSPGQTFAIAVFTPHLQATLGLTSSKLAAAYMLGTFFAAFPLSVIGPLSDRFGLRWTTVGVALGLSLSCWVVSAATGFFSLLLGFLLLRFLGQGALTLLGGNLVSMWFQKRLGTVNSVMSAGGAAAFAVVPLLLLECIESVGWRWTYVAIGAALMLTIVPCAVLLMRDRPEDLGQLPDGLRLPASTCQTSVIAAVCEPELTLSAAMRHRTFWILAVGMALWAMIGTGIVFYSLPIYDQYGIAPDRSKLLFATFSASMLVFQIVGGILADRAAMHRLLAIGFALLFAGAAVVPLTTGELHVHIFALLFGAGQGIALSVNATMWVRYYGRQHLGKIRGAVWCTTVAGSGCGPFILGLFQDNLGSFTPGLWVFVGLLAPLPILSLWATAPPIDDCEIDDCEIEESPGLAVGSLVGPTWRREDESAGEHAKSPDAPHR